MTHQRSHVPVASAEPRQQKQRYDGGDGKPAVSERMIRGGFLPEEWNADAKRKAWTRQKLEVLGGCSARLKNVGIELVQTLLLIFAFFHPVYCFYRASSSALPPFRNSDQVSHVFIRHILGHLVSLFHDLSTDARAQNKIEHAVQLVRG